MFKNSFKLLCRCVAILFLLFTLHLTLYTVTSAAPFSAKISLVTGAVEVKVAGVWKKAEKNMTLSEKDEIRTGQGGRAVILLEDGSRMTLDENSSLALSELQENNVQVAMSAGTMKAQVKKMSTGGKFQVGTPASVCAVRGTSFKVKAKEKETEIECYRGSVNVIKSETLEETMLSRWQKILVSQEQPLSKPAMMSKEEKTLVLAPAKTELSQEVRMGMSREAVQAAAAQEIKLAEYQQGKSLIDAFGKRVRLEEYIVRPLNPTTNEYDRFKMVVLNERENRFDYFTWTATFNKKLPADLMEVTSKVAWNLGDTQSQSDYFLKANESAASNTVDKVEWGFTGGHLIGLNNTLLFDNYYFRLGTKGMADKEKISYEPKLGSNIQSLDDVYYYVNGDRNTPITDTDFWKSGSWWDSNIVTTSRGYSFKDGSYKEEYYIIDDNGKEATTEEFSKVWDSSAQKLKKDELLKWNFENVFTASNFFAGPDKKIDLVVEPKIFIDAGIIQAK
jgi:hypothetical protein